jgi:NAD(P)-dependent dehydrogenase (short-subunit alcohol dehydrogenase family)
VSDNDRVAVVTGGTMGIGNHIAGLLASDGWAVAICARDGARSRQAADELRAAHGVEAYGAGVDVRSVAELDDFASAVEAELGVPRAVIANAAVPGPIGPLHTVDLAAWADAIAIDLVGVAASFATFARPMVRAGRGHLITMSGGGVGGPNVATTMSAYTCSKAAVVALTESVAEELRPHGVAVNAIAPGAVATRFMDPVIAAGPDVVGASFFEQTSRQRGEETQLAGLDALLRCLLDDAAPFVTGRVLSSRWDDPDLLRAAPPADRSSMYRLRRIDGVMYGPIGTAE